MISNEQIQAIDHRFNYHQPPNDETAARHAAVRGEIKEAAMRVVDLVPEGREQSLALTKLEEAMMWANAGIARISR